MLTLYHSRPVRGERPADLAKESLPTNVAWIDLLRPDPDEIAFVKRTTGLDVPNIGDVSEIEKLQPPAQSKRRDLSECAADLSRRYVYRPRSGGRKRPAEQCCGLCRPDGCDCRPP